MPSSGSAFDHLNSVPTPSITLQILHGWNAVFRLMSRPTVDRSGCVRNGGKTPAAPRGPSCVRVAPCPRPLGRSSSTRPSMYTFRMSLPEPQRPVPDRQFLPPACRTSDTRPEVSPPESPRSWNLAMPNLQDIPEFAESRPVLRVWRMQRASGPGRAELAQRGVGSYVAGQIPARGAQSSDVPKLASSTTIVAEIRHPPSAHTQLSGITPLKGVPTLIEYCTGMSRPNRSCNNGGVCSSPPMRLRSSETRPSMKPPAYCQRPVMPA